MITYANVQVTSSNNTITANSVVGVAVEDVLVSDTILRDRNIRVLAVDEANATVTLNQTIGVFTGNIVQFQTLISGTGLINSISRNAYFMRDKPAYAPEADPRLPKHTKLAANLYPGNTSIQLDSLTNVFPITVPGSVIEDLYAAKIHLNNKGDVQISDYVLAGNLTLESNIRVTWLGEGNTYIGVNKQVPSTSGQTIYFQRPEKPYLRVGSETIWYSNIDVGTSSVTDITRNIAGTQPADDWVWPANTVVSILGSVAL